MRKFILPLLAIVFLSQLMSCQENAPKAKRLFVIGIDGTSSKAFAKADMPFMKEFLPQSSYSLKKRSVLPSSSAINWATMFMSSTPEMHGYTDWGTRTPEIPSRVIIENNIFPTIFQLYRKTYPQSKMGCFYEWNGMKYVVDTAAFDYHKQSSGEELEKNAIEFIKTKPDVGVFIYDNPDHVGHQHGWDSCEYHKMLTKLDGNIKNIIDAIKEQGMYEESMIVIISDHGGINHGHGGKTLDEIEAPAIFEGPGIKKGFCMDETWCMHQYDVGATIAKEFAIEIPQVWAGKPAMAIFE